MSTPPPTYPRILAIAPSSRGFGFAVLERYDTLVDWGVKSVRGDKNTQSAAKVRDLLADYGPNLMVTEATTGSRRSARIRALAKRIGAAAVDRGVRVVLFSREQVRQVFATDAPATKNAVAEIVAKRFPEELAFRLPPKRRPWMSEDYRMAIFDAVALVLMPRLTKKRRVGS